MLTSIRTPYFYISNSSGGSILVPVVFAIKICMVELINCFKQIQPFTILMFCFLCKSVMNFDRVCVVVVHVIMTDTTKNTIYVICDLASSVNLVDCGLWTKHTI